MPTTAGPKDDGSDAAMMAAPPPLPPILTATTAAAVYVPVLPETSTETNASPSSLQEQQENASASAAGLINFDNIMAELQTWQSENNGSLVIPSSNPALMRIMDSITSTGLEALTSKRWEGQLLALTSYKQRYGTCDVPINHPTLGAWTSEQRYYYRQYEQGLPNPLTAERYEQLKNIGITINRWEKRLVELKAYQVEHGHCDVPIDYPSGLGIWVSTQRDHAHWNRDEMSKERIASLDAVGFNWNRWGHSRTKNRQDAWETQFVQLEEYIREHGHSNISQHDKDNGRLGKWVKNQRYEYRKFMNKGLGQSRLGRDRIEKLESIGFQWRLRPEIVPWGARFELLKQYKLHHGHCHVPLDHSDLGKWAKYQRDQYSAFLLGKPCKMTQEKFDQLKEIGFEESLDEQVHDYVGDSSMNADSPDDQKKIRAATTARTKTDEFEFPTGGMADQPNIYGDQHGGQEYQSEQIYRQQGMSGQTYDQNSSQSPQQGVFNASGQQPFYQKQKQGFGGHSY